MDIPISEMNPIGDPNKPRKDGGQEYMFQGAYYLRMPPSGPMWLEGSLNEFRWVSSEMEQWLEGIYQRQYDRQHEQDKEVRG